eukprot:GHRR01017487.1.p1 GENE.GHRR01017487.1~~GHRR01017487.1.p1  ORF type:complete len:576 (+),score=143.08 GHRR01017487.1:1338-3065(+)
MRHQALMQQTKPSDRNNLAISIQEAWCSLKRMGRIWLCAACCSTILWVLRPQTFWLQQQQQTAKLNRVLPILKAANPITHLDAHQQVDGKLVYPVWWQAPFYSGTGYSVEAISYVVALLQSKQICKEDLWISQSGDGMVDRAMDSLDPSVKQALEGQYHSRLATNAVYAKELQRPTVVVCHSFPECWFLQKDMNNMEVPGCPCPEPDDNTVVFRVGRTMFETNSLPQHLVDHCNAMDEIWVPTQFNKDTFTAAGVAADKLFVVPQGIDTDFWNPSKYAPLVLRELPGVQLIAGRVPGIDASYGINQRPFVFLSVFKWEARKGWDILLDAYLREFKPEEAVELHIVTKAFGNSQENFREHVLTWMQRRLALLPHQVIFLPRVFVHSQHLDDVMYPRLYASCDCVVLPTRGEGWGRPQMEAMAMGKPVITTNWSGPTAYISQDVAYPLSITHLTAADADMDMTSINIKEVNPYFQGQLWAQPNVTQLRELMRHVISHPQEGAAKGQAARRHIQQHFTPQVVADVLMSNIMRIQTKLRSNKVTLLPPVDGISPAERAIAKSTRAACTAYPHLCKKGGT